jgi:hypothetical protein
MTHYILKCYSMGSERDFREKMKSGQFPGLKELQENQVLGVFCEGLNEVDGYYTYNADRLDSFVSNRRNQPHQIAGMEDNPLANHADTLAMLLGEAKAGDVLILRIDHPDTTPMSIKQRYQRYKVYVLDEKLRRGYKELMAGR